MTAVILEPSHELSEGALEQLRLLLKSERAVQESIVTERDATVAELTGQMDVDSILEREVAEASAARARDALEDIDDALARMDAGTYGRCQSCERPIPFERLEAIPHSRFCVACASRRAQLTAVPKAAPTP